MQIPVTNNVEGNIGGAGAPIKCASASRLTAAQRQVTELIQCLLVGGAVLAMLLLVASAFDTDRTRYVTALWEIDPTGERPSRRLTRSAKGERSPVFTPTGDLLFVSARPVPGAKPDAAAPAKPPADAAKPDAAKPDAANKPDAAKPGDAAQDDPAVDYQLMRALDLVRGISLYANRDK